MVTYFDGFGTKTWGSGLLCFFSAIQVLLYFFLDNAV